MHGLQCILAPCRPIHGLHLLGKVPPVGDRGTFGAGHEVWPQEQVVADDVLIVGHLLGDLLEVLDELDRVAQRRVGARAEDVETARLRHDVEQQGHQDTMLRVERLTVPEKF